MKKILENYLTLKDDLLTERLNNIVTIIGQVHRIPPKELMVTSGRRREIVQARNTACSVMRSSLELSLEEIAESLGYKSHSSILHALKMHEMDIKFDRIYKNKYHSIMECLVETNHDNKSVNLNDHGETMRMFHLRLLNLENKLDDLTSIINK